MLKWSPKTFSKNTQVMCKEKYTPIIDTKKDELVITTIDRKRYYLRRRSSSNSSELETSSSFDLGSSSSINFRDLSDKNELKFIKWKSEHECKSPSKLSNSLNSQLNSSGIYNKRVSRHSLPSKLLNTTNNGTKNIIESNKTENEDKSKCEQLDIDCVDKVPKSVCKLRRKNGCYIKGFNYQHYIDTKRKLKEEYFDLKNTLNEGDNRGNIKNDKNFME